MTVTLNGETRALDGPVSVAGLLATLGLEGARSRWSATKRSCRARATRETWLASGDALEIVHFIGGG